MPNEAHQLISQQSVAWFHMNIFSFVFSCINYKFIWYGSVCLHVRFRYVLHHYYNILFLSLVIFFSLWESKDRPIGDLIYSQFCLIDSLIDWHIALKFIFILFICIFIYCCCVVVSLTYKSCFIHIIPLLGISKLFLISFVPTRQTRSIWCRLDSSEAWL